MFAYNDPQLNAICNDCRMSYLHCGLIGKAKESKFEIGGTIQERFMFFDERYCKQCHCT